MAQANYLPFSLFFTNVRTHDKKITTYTDTTLIQQYKKYTGIYAYKIQNE